MTHYRTERNSGKTDDFRTVVFGVRYEPSEFEIVRALFERHRPVLEAVAAANRARTGMRISSHNIPTLETLVDRF